jgi:hypothetical protein
MSWLLLVRLDDPPIGKCPTHHLDKEAAPSNDPARTRVTMTGSVLDKAE